MDRYRGLAVQASACVAAGLLGLGACGDDLAAIDAAVPVDAPSTTMRSIQEVQDGTVATGASVSIDKVFVTAMRISNLGNMLAFVQEPDGVTTGGHTYPQYAGVRVFFSGTELNQLPGLGAIQIRHCLPPTGRSPGVTDQPGRAKGVELAHLEDGRAAVAVLRMAVQCPNQFALHEQRREFVARGGFNFTGSFA